RGLPPRGCAACCTTPRRDAVPLSRAGDIVDFRSAETGHPGGGRFVAAIAGDSCLEKAFSARCSVVENRLTTRSYLRSKSAKFAGAAWDNGIDMKKTTWPVAVELAEPAADEHELVLGDEPSTGELE